MAAVYSQGSQQHQGGDWGWVQRSVLRKELGDVAFSLDTRAGQRSNRCQPDAVYVMLVEDKKTAPVPGRWPMCAPILRRH